MTLTDILETSEINYEASQQIIMEIRDIGRSIKRASDDISELRIEIEALNRNVCEMKEYLREGDPFLIAGEEWSRGYSFGLTTKVLIDDEAGKGRLSEIVRILTEGTPTLEDRMIIRCMSKAREKIDELQ